MCRQKEEGADDDGMCVKVFTEMYGMVREGDDDDDDHSLSALTFRLNEANS